MSTKINKISIAPHPATKFTSGAYYVLKGTKAGSNKKIAVFADASDDANPQIEILSSPDEITSCSNGDPSSFLWEWVPNTNTVGYFRNVKTGQYLQVGGPWKEETGLSTEKPSTWIGWSVPQCTLVAYSGEQPAEWISFVPSYHTLVVSIYKMYINQKRIGAASGCVDTNIAAYPAAI